MNARHNIDNQTNKLFKTRYLHECKRVNRLMIALMIAQWFAGVAFAAFYSPLTWIGQHYEIHIHIWAAILLGGAISGFATLWARVNPDAAHTRHVIAISQMLWSALLIHLTGGRIETHFHVFASLAILSIYRDWKILITATVVVAIDHLVRGIFYPLSAFGIITESPYRWIEHAAWVSFEVAFLAPGCMRLRNEFRELCVRQTELEEAKASVDIKVQERTQELVAANTLLAEKTAEAEKLALVARYTDNAVVITDRHSRIEWVNEGFIRITGYNAREVIGRKPSDFQYGPETDPETINFMRASIANQTGFDTEVVQYRKNGEPYWQSAEVRPILSVNNDVFGFIAIGRDISERKAIEMSLSAAEQRLRSLVNNVPGAFYRCTADNQSMLFVSNSIEEISGYSPEDFVGGSVALRGIIHPDDQQLVSDMVQQAITQQESYEIEYRIVDSQQNTKWVWERGQCLIDDDANKILDGMIFDITERKLAEADIASKGKLIEESLNEIYTFDAATLKFQYVNRAGRKNLGYELDEICCLTPVDIKPEFDFVSFKEMIRPLETGKRRQMVLLTQHERKDKSRYDVEVCLQMSQYDGKEVFLAIILDITDRVRAQAQNKRLQEELINASRKAGMADVATGVLHNVGNILNSVNISTSVIRRRMDQSAFAHLQRVSNLITEHDTSFADFVRDDHRGQKVPAYIKGVTTALSSEREKINEEFNDLLKNVDHIKEIVNVQQSMAKASGVKRKLRPSELMQDVMAATKGSLANHRIEVQQADCRNVPEFVSDKHKVLQVLINLVGNAKDAVVEQRSKDRTIWMDVDANDTHILFRITDNGVGIAGDKIDQLFRHGFTTKTTGHGFGLHSCANAATEIGGNLTVSSDGIGKGATFVLAIPHTSEQAPSPQTSSSVPQHDQPQLHR